jgi:hypothetical protein
MKKPFFKEIFMDVRFFPKTHISIYVSLRIRFLNFFVFERDRLVSKQLRIQTTSNPHTFFLCF